MNHSAPAVDPSTPLPSGGTPLPPGLQTALLYLVVGTTMAIRPHPAIRLPISVLLAYVCYHSSVACSRATSTSDSLGAYSWGAAFGVALLAVPLLLWLDDPMKWRYRDEPTAPETYPLWERIYYALCIVWNFRSIGWSTQVDNVPAPTTKSRAVFLQHAAISWVKGVLVADLAQTYIQLQPLFELQGTPAFPTGLRGYVMSCACLLAYGAKAYANLRVRYLSLAIVCVATGLGTADPEMWPDTNGRWADAYSVRRFWGRTWHQNVRRHLSACGKAVAAALGFKKGSNASSYSQLYTAFFLSGFFHCFGDLAIGAPFGSSMPFFVANAAAITLEDAVIAVGRRLGVGSASDPANSAAEGKGKEGPPPRWVRVVGYAWVFVWFSYALRLFVWWAVPYGMGKIRSNVVPLEVVQRFAPEALLSLMRASL